MPLISAFSGSQFEMMILQALLYKLFIPFLAVFRWSVSCWKLHLYFIMCLFISLSQKKKNGLCELPDFLPKLKVFTFCTMQSCPEYVTRCLLTDPAWVAEQIQCLHLCSFSWMWIQRCIFKFLAPLKGLQLLISVDGHVSIQVSSSSE